MMHAGDGRLGRWVHPPSKDDCATAEGRGPGRNEAETGWKCLELGIGWGVSPQMLRHFPDETWPFEWGKYGAGIAKWV